MDLRNFLEELKRRNVVKATIAYLAVAWVIVQIASVIFPAFDAPEYAMKVVLYVLAVGLVLWIGFSWVYDLTPDGIQKTEDLQQNEADLQWNNRRWNRIIGVSLGLAIILLLGISFWAGSQWSVKDKVQTMKLAVLPLETKDPNAVEDYYLEGMTEIFIGELSKTDRLAVVNEPSSRVLLAGISNGNSLITNVVKDIDYYVYGTIQKTETQIEADIALKTSLDAKPIWQKNYHRDITDPRNLWGGVAMDLSRQLGVDIGDQEVLLWTNLKKSNPETFELYLKGRSHLNKSTPADWEKGLLFLEEAIDRNPTDSYAYANLAEAYVNLGHGPDPDPNVFPKALAAAKRAIQLDSTNALGWAALSHYHTYFGMDWNLADYAFRKAETLNPNLANNYFHRSWYLALFGKMDEAIAAHIKAQELDPFTPVNTAWLGELYRMVGEYEKGLEETYKADEIEDGFAIGHFVRGRILVDQGKTSEGISSLKRAGEIFPAWKYLGYGPSLIRVGQREKGLQLLAELEKAPMTPWNALCRLTFYIQLEDYDKALECMEYEPRHAWYPWTRVIFTNEAFRKDPRFLKIIHELDLPDPAPLQYTPDRDS